MNKKYFIVSKIELHKTFFNFIKEENYKKAEKLLNKGANIDYQDENGDTILMICLLEKKLQQIPWILNHGADPNIHNHIKNEGALLHALGNLNSQDYKYVKYVKLLLDAGCIPYVCDGEGNYLSIPSFILSPEQKEDITEYVEKLNHHIKPAKNK